MNYIPTIGIDLGTTFSCVGAYQRGCIEIFANDRGNRTTPSVVSFNQGQCLIGEAAQQKSISNVTNTIYDSKRMLGRRFDDAIFQNDIKNWQFEVYNDEGRPQIHVRFQGSEQSYQPEEISSMILGKMKDIAKLRLGNEVKNAVITVPAYFNDAQRQATKDAASVAGLKVVQLLNEPIAAAIAYGLDKQRDCERKVLIYDLGGGTFDVSLLTVRNKDFIVETYAGNSHLGGQDFNNRMTEHLLQEFNRKYKIDISSDKKAIAKLRYACETAKRELSSVPIARIEIENLVDRICFNTSMSRSTFEILNYDLFQSTINEVEKALRKINWTKSMIDDIVLIGGSTRITKISEMLRNYFDGKTLYTSISPDEAVAYGAAMYAAILDGKDPKLRSFKFTDVTPMALGTDLDGGFYSIIIPQNTKLPAEKTRTYQTAKDSQTSMSVQVLEGEKTMCNDNFMLGQFSLKNLPPLPKGEVKANVTFKVDENGILHARAQDNSNSCNMKSIDIVYLQNRLTRDEIDRMTERADNLHLNEVRHKEKSFIKKQHEQESYEMLKYARNQAASTSTSSGNNLVSLNRAADSNFSDQVNHKTTEIKIKGKASVVVPMRFIGDIKVDGEVDFEFRESHLISDNSVQNNQSQRDQATHNIRTENQKSLHSDVTEK